MKCSMGKIIQQTSLKTRSVLVLIIEVGILKAELLSPILRVWCDNLFFKKIGKTVVKVIWHIASLLFDYKITHNLLHFLDKT